MAMTLPTAEDLFEETVRKVSSTPQEWLKFLNAELDMKPKEEPKKMIKKEELKKCL